MGDIHILVRTAMEYTFARQSNDYPQYSSYCRNIERNGSVQIVERMKIGGGTRVVRMSKLLIVMLTGPTRQLPMLNLMHHLREMERTCVCPHLPMHRSLSRLVWSPVGSSRRWITLEALDHNRMEMPAERSVIMAKPEMRYPWSR